MPATLIDETRSEALALDVSPIPASPAPRLASRLLSAPQRPLPSRRRRRVTGRLTRLAALFAMGAWVALGLMPIVAVLLAVYGS